MVLIESAVSIQRLGYCAADLHAEIGRSVQEKLAVEEALGLSHDFAERGQVLYAYGGEMVDHSCKARLTAELDSGTWNRRDLNAARNRDVSNCATYDLNPKASTSVRICRDANCSFLSVRAQS